jgi:CheY-like chemotaxis protein
MTSSPIGVSRQDVHVLLVEDDPGDVMLVRESFEYHKIVNPLDVVSDGVEALAFLRQEAPFTEAIRPALIMLDLNLPRMDGREVLTQIKSDPDLRSIPVVVLTTSVADEDIERSYDTHANAYVTKPVDFDRFMRVVQQIDEFFISVVQRPR